MHRHRRRHRALRPRAALRRGGLAAGAVAVAVALVVALVGLVTPGPDGTASRDVSALSSSTAPGDLTAGDLTAGGTAVPAEVVDRGTVRGVLRLTTDVAADPDTWVAYLIKGPASVIKVSSSAPYGAEVDTRALPDGSYTVNEVVFHSARVPKVALSRVTVDNVGDPIPSAATTEPADDPVRPDVPSQPSDPSVAPNTASSEPPAAAADAAPAGDQSAAGPSRSDAGPSLSPPESAPESSPAVAVATTSPASATTPAPAATPVAPSSGPIEQVVALTNAERAKVGCGALAVDGRLAASAQAHSADMAINNYFSHSGRDGRSPFQRIIGAGYTFSVAAENIAAGQRTAADVVAGWMNSAGHRANILNCSLTQVGVGFATGGSYGTYWTQDFGTP